MTSNLVWYRYNYGPVQSSGLSSIARGIGAYLPRLFKLIIVLVGSAPRVIVALSVRTCILNCVVDNCLDCSCGRSVTTCSLILAGNLDKTWWHE